MSGTNTPKHNAQVKNIERDGFWLLTDEGEYFVSFEDYPVFRQATVNQIHNFQLDTDHLRWPDLDVDIEMGALKHPERFPLEFKP